jgi:hypothetical protein
MNDLITRLREVAQTCSDQAQAMETKGFKGTARSWAAQGQTADDAADALEAIAESAVKAVVERARVLAREIGLVESVVAERTGALASDRKDVSARLKDWESKAWWIAEALDSLPPTPPPAPTGDAAPPCCDGLVAIQRHRDQWRGYAYGVRPKPDDFLDGNRVHRDATRIEVLEAENAQLRADCDARVRAGQRAVLSEVWDEMAEAVAHLDRALNATSLRIAALDAPREGR